ncbi:heme-dependent oxidative N-demethylase family protein [Lentibacter sp.]|uniref:heme-dependent oxidative N-demethylase family protein n=1 Tax=Lentibacter sp. TaxID=2024994 RepID=UPI003F6A37D3
MILNQSIPYDPLSPKPLPGMSPLDPKDWLRVDETYAAQLAEKARVVAADRDMVLALDEAARPAAEELLDMVVSALSDIDGFYLQNMMMRCPDGRNVAVDRADPMLTLSRLIQEDFCILQKTGDEHVLTGAVLCFPASWLLAEKFMQPLIGIHEPVASYDADIARRVQRLFDGVRVAQPLWRFNALWYADPALHQPRSAHSRRDERFVEAAQYMRSELQTIRRLPETDAVVFGIHTYVLTQDSLNRRAALA